MTYVFLMSLNSYLNPTSEIIITSHHSLSIFVKYHISIYLVAFIRYMSYIDAQGRKRKTYEKIKEKEEKYGLAQLVSRGDCITKLPGKPEKTFTKIKYMGSKSNIDYEKIQKEGHKLLGTTPLTIGGTKIDKMYEEYMQVWEDLNIIKTIDNKSLEEHNRTWKELSKMMDDEIISDYDEEEEDDMEIIIEI
jgi:hypothetical protein